MADELSTIAPPDEAPAAPNPAENQKFATATEGFARGLTGGLSDLWLTKDLGFDPKYIKNRIETNPILSTTSSIAGQIPALAAMGPVEGIGANAALGAGLSATDLVSDYALGDPDLNAQKILSHIGFGAALGGGLGKLMESGLTSKLGNALKAATDTEAVQAATKSDMLSSFMKGAQGLPEKDLAAPIRKMTGNLDEVYSTLKDTVKDLQDSVEKHYDPFMKKEVISGLSPEVNGLMQEYNNLMKENGFEQAFTKMTPSGRVVDPSKVSSFFKNIDAPGQDIKRGLLEDFFDLSKRVADAQENKMGFEGARESIGDRFAALSKEQGDLADLASAMARKQGPSKVIPWITGGVGSMIGGPTGGAIGYGLGHVIANPYEVGKALHQGIQGLQTAGKIISDIGSIIDKGALNVFKGEKASSATIGSMPRSKFDKITDRINTLADPHAMINHLENNMGNMKQQLPNIAPFMQATIQRGTQFLQEKIPQPASQLPLDAKFEATPSQVSKFAEYYNAVNDPTVALKQIKQGTLSNETMETLNTVYPQLLHQMRVALAENMDRNTKNMPYSVKISLAKFMGQPLDSFQTPQSMMANQIAINSPIKQLGSRMSQGPTIGGMKQLKMSRNASSSMRKNMAGDTDE